MPQLDAQKIQQVLQEEVPEFKLSRDSGTLLSVVAMLLFSSAMASVVLVGLAWGSVYYLEFDVGDEIFMVIAAVAPFLGFGVGYLTKDSMSSPGTEMTESALKRETSTFGYYNRDDQARDAGAGCVVFLLQALAGGIYGSVAQLRQFAGPDHAKEQALATSILHHLLENGPTSTTEMARSLEEQGVARAQIHTTLSLLRNAGLLEPSLETLSVSPPKRHLFEA